MKSSSNAAFWNNNDLFSRQNTQDAYVSRGQHFNEVQSVRGQHPSMQIQYAFNSISPSDTIFSRNNNKNTTNNYHHKPLQKYYDNQTPFNPVLSSPTSSNNLDNNHTQDIYKKGSTVSMHLQTHHGNSKSLDQQALKNNFVGDKKSFNIKNNLNHSPELVGYQNQPQQALLLQEKQLKYQQSGQIFSPAVVAASANRHNGKQFSQYSSATATVATQEMEQLVSSEIFRNECNTKKNQHTSQHSNSMSSINMDRLLSSGKNMNVNLISSSNFGQKQGPVMVVGQHVRNHSDCENIQKKRQQNDSSQLLQQNQLILQEIEAFKSNYQYKQSVLLSQDSQKTQINSQKGQNNPKTIFELPLRTKSKQNNQRAKSESTEFGGYFLKNNQQIAGKVINTCDDETNEDSVDQKDKKQIMMRASTPKMTNGVDRLIQKEEKINLQTNNHSDDDNTCVDLKSFTKDMSVDFSNVEEISLMIDENKKELGPKDLTQPCSKDQLIQQLNRQIEELKKENSFLRQQVQLSCEGNALRETELRSNLQQCLNEKMNGIIKIEELQQHLVNLSEQLRKERQKVSDAMLITCQLENYKTISNVDRVVLEEIKREFNLEGARSDEILPKIRQLLDKDAQKLVDCLTEMIVNFTPYNKHMESKPSIKSIWKWLKTVLNEYIILKSNREEIHQFTNQK